eukprot:11212665-Lingulodinium_polyedra.AAC.1
MPCHAIPRHGDRRNGLQTARSRAPRADRKPARAWHAQTRDLRAAAATDARFDRIAPQRLQNAAQRR